MTLRRWLAIALIFGCSCSGYTQIQFRTVYREIVEQRLKSLSAENYQRGTILKHAFESAGCTNLSEQTVKHLPQPNLICVLPGEDSATIVVGAHLDKVSSGTGAVDDWSGAALLPSLFESLAPERHKHTFVFVAFAGEESGLVGSEWYVKHLQPSDIKAISAMVNLECLGLSTTEVWATHSDKTLVSLLARTANAMKVPLIAVNVDNVGNDDSDSFKRKKVPNITLHSLTQATWHILHSRDDTLDKINLSEYYETYRLTAAFLSVLDTVPPAGNTASEK